MEERRASLPLKQYRNTAVQCVALPLDAPRPFVLVWRGRLDLQVCFDGRAPAVFMCSFYHTWVRTAKGTAACCATDNDTNPRIRRTNAELKLGLDWQRHRA